MKRKQSFFEYFSRYDVVQQWGHKHCWNIFITRMPKKRSYSMDVP